MKQNMSVKFATLALAVAMATQTFFVPRAEAYQIISLITGDINDETTLSPGTKILCSTPLIVVCLPMIILGNEQQQGSGLPVIEKQWLDANGYTTEEQDQLAHDLERIKAKGLGIKLDPKESKLSLTQALLKIDPLMAPSSIDIILNFLGLTK